MGDFLPRQVIPLKLTVHLQKEKFVIPLSEPVFLVFTGSASGVTREA